MSIVDPAEHRWITIDAASIIGHQLGRSAEAVEASRGQPLACLDAVRSAHCALTSLLFLVLEGSDGTGAMRPRAMRQWRAYNERPEGAWPDEGTMSFLELVNAVQEPGRLQQGEAITFDEAELLSLRELNWLRETIDHPKHVRWTTDRSGFIRPIAVLLDPIERLIANAGHRLYGQDRATAHDGLRSLHEAIGRG